LAGAGPNAWTARPVWLAAIMGCEAAATWSWADFGPTLFIFFPIFLNFVISLNIPKIGSNLQNSYKIVETSERIQT
jgi:hypothetical protein